MSCSNDFDLNSSDFSNMSNERVQEEGGRGFNLWKF